MKSVVVDFESCYNRKKSKGRLPQNSGWGADQRVRQI